MQAIHTGDRLWSAVSRKPLEALELSDETRDLLRRGLFVEPLPEVSRVVFIATPHRGSFVAARQVVTNLVRWLVTLPAASTGVRAGIARNRDALLPGVVIPSAVDNMSPRHHFIRALQEIPVAPSITAHSIIAVQGRDRSSRATTASSRTRAPTSTGSSPSSWCSRRATPL